MKTGDLVRHKTALDWGIGVIVHVSSDKTKCKINFELRKQVLLALSTAEQQLEPVDPVEVATGSALLVQERWPELELAPEQRPGNKYVTGHAPQCEHCHQPLNRGVYSPDRLQKACPRCSTRAGSQHVFYACPEGFGQSTERITENNPNGDQSYCYACRAYEQPATPSGCLAARP